ncbi:MAG TPA: flotillin family protein, partial [Thermoanaerobaculia bacterium]|nr:flotillin family protein [Thermoanaerobaculia bacterium]
KRLVEQTLDPMVSAYFKNVGQTRTLIQLLQDRSAIQEIAGVQMKERFAQYNLDLEEVLIGTPSANAGVSGATGGVQIEEILSQLRSRQIAEEKVETYKRQEGAAIKERELREAESRAKQQPLLTESEISITVQSNEGKAEFARAQQRAVQIETLARAEAERSARVGLAQAMVIEEQVKAYGGPQFQLFQQVLGRFAEAIEKAQVDLVPRMYLSSGGSGTNGGPGSGNLIENLLGLLLAEKVGDRFGIVPAAGGETNPLAESLKAEIRARLAEQEGTAAA